MERGQTDALMACGGVTLQAVGLIKAAGGGKAISEPNDGFQRF